jgi:hypothetical protein
MTGREQKRAAQLLTDLEVIALLQSPSLAKALAAELRHLLDLPEIDPSERIR